MRKEVRMVESVYKIRGSFYASKFEKILLMLYPVKKSIADGLEIKYKIMRGKVYFVGIRKGGD